MKIRNGFVSNSSSSSFVIKGKEKQDEAIEILKQIYNADYYIHNDILYTSYISDCIDRELFSKLDKLSVEDVSGDYGPYEPDDFVEVEGIMGINSVWLDKQILSDKDLISLGHVPTHIAEKLYRYVTSGVNSSDKKLFYETCIKIVEGEIEDEN